MLRALERPRRVVDVGPLNRVQTLGFRLLPGVYDTLVTPPMERLPLPGSRPRAQPEVLGLVSAAIQGRLAQWGA